MRVVFKDEDIMPGAVVVGPVTIIDDNGTAALVDEGAWQTQADAEKIAATFNVQLEVT